MLLQEMALTLALLAGTVPAAWGLSGTFFTSGILSGKWLPNPAEVSMIDTPDDCQDICARSKYCNAYAVSEFERKCNLHEVLPGVAPVKNSNYRIYILMKKEVDGYYVFGTDYIKLSDDRHTNYDGAKNCSKEGGRLVSVRSSAMNELLLRLLTKFNVWQAYIGLSDATKEGVWRYADTGLASYTNWDWNGQWERADRNCALVTIAEFGPWKHVDCWERNYYFCQIPMF